MLKNVFSSARLMPRFARASRPALVPNVKFSASFEQAPLSDVRANHVLDETRLCDFLYKNKLFGNIDSGSLTIKQFSHGQSNPTYVISHGSNPSEKLVLRKQPPGKLLRGAHAVDREFMVMLSLARSNVPVPEVKLYCSDPGKLIQSLPIIAVGPTYAVVSSN